MTAPKPPFWHMFVALLFSWAVMYGAHSAWGGGSEVEHYFGLGVSVFLSVVAYVAVTRILARRPPWRS